MVLAVNGWDESKEDILRFAKKHDLTYTMLLEGGDIAKQYGVYRYPTVLWLDAKGVVTDVELGYHGPEDLEERTKSLLKAGDTR